MNKNFWILFLTAATVTLGTTVVWQNIQMFGQGKSGSVPSQK